MAHILVVDDSPDQARMVSMLMETAGHTAEVAGDGSAGLEAIARKAPDLVITDLIMPGLNGLELVEAIREQFPGVPVILMTAFGNSEIAVRALQKGAASYVPKLRLRDEIVATAESTLAVARSKRDRERMLQCLVESESRFELTNDQSLIPPLVGFVQDIVSNRCRAIDETGIMQVGIAVQEALLNAMHHGNLEVSSEHRETGGEDYQKLVKKRADDARYGSRFIKMAVKCSRDRLQCEVQDEGPGFDPSTVDNPTDPANLEKVSGRGLYLIYTFMDEVRHNDVGNQITMIKNWPHARPTAHHDHDRGHE